MNKSKFESNASVAKADVRKVGKDNTYVAQLIEDKLPAVAKQIRESTQSVHELYLLGKLETIPGVGIQNLRIVEKAVERLISKKLSEKYPIPQVEVGYGTLTSGKVLTHHDHIGMKQLLPEDPWTYYED